MMTQRKMLGVGVVIASASFKCSRLAGPSSGGLSRGEKMKNPNSSTGARTPARDYALGHSDAELDRLAVQARLVDPITRGFFRDAGIVPGMRVLDVGSGVGDVAFLAAGLVGDTGEVVGVDRAPAALVTARERADAMSLRHVSFREGDPADMAFEQPFDAVVGRYVLMFQREPTTMLKKLVAHLRPGGIVVFHEPDWNSARSFPPVPTYDRCCRWIVDTLRLSGADPRMGIKLHATFVAAGLPPPSMRLESVIGGGANSSDQVHFKTDLARTLVPEMERLSVATAREVDAQTLAERVLNEIIGSASVIVGRSEIGAWSRA
jgi:SAM-dependent methyltransferase